MITTHVRIQRGRSLLRQGRVDAAIIDFTRIGEENPRNVATWVDLAQAYVRRDRHLRPEARRGGAG